MKHGLTANVLRTAAEVELVGEAVAKPPGELGTSPFDREFLESEIELISHRLERSGKIEDRLRVRASLRASICWEGDRRSEIETIGAAIHRRPADVSKKLEETPQGCLWMIERWAMLARVADRDGTWDETARSLAFDLLGTPDGFRTGEIGEGIDFDGRVVKAGTDLAQLARAESARLIAVRETLFDLDDFDRSSTEAGLAEDLGAAGQRIRSYQRELHRRLRWYHKLLEEIPALAAPTIAETPPAEVSDPSSSPSPSPDEPATEELEPEDHTHMPGFTRKDRRAKITERRRVAAERKRIRRLVE